VETAGDGVAGLEAIGWFKPDLVLLNIMMPRMDGLTMLENLGKRALARKPRVVMASACCDYRTFELTQARGAVEFIYYPCDPKAVAEIVRDALDDSFAPGQRRIRAQLRRLQFQGWGSCETVLEEVRRLPLGRLSVEQRGLTRECLLRAAEKHRARGRRGGRLYPGIDAALQASAIARAL